MKGMLEVATVLTVYGIETIINFSQTTKISFISLQQYLPFTVLKPSNLSFTHDNLWLQQYLPFTVLKLPENSFFTKTNRKSCNSTYRLRY